MKQNLQNVNQPNTNELLNRDIELLDKMLEEILFTHGGQSLVDRVKKIRVLATSWRADEHADISDDDIKSEIAALGFDERQDVIRAFTAFLHLVNVAEQNNRIRRHLSYELEENKTSQPFSVENAIVNLKEAGYNAEDIKDALPHLSIRLITTAHPTEATKRSILDIKKRLSLRLKELDNPMLSEKEVEFIKENILNEVAILWQSNELSNQKPGVLDEVRSGLYYYEHTLFDILPDIHREMEISLRKHFPEVEWKVPNFLRFGSWIGGDRDGNPFVTHDITWQTLALQRELIIEKYKEAFDHLIDRYSYCTTRIKVSDDLIELIESKENKYLTNCTKWPIETEMYRRALAFMRFRLTQVGISEMGYKNPEELLDELRIIRESLKHHLPSHDELRRINRIIRQIKLFGFHLASLEVRNHSGEHEEAMNEILDKVNIAKDYASLSEEEKQKTLNYVLSDPRPLLLRGESYSEKTREMIATFKTIKRAHDEFGAIAIPTYIISMTQSASDLLEVLVFAKEVGLYYLHPDGQITTTLKIAPLFETIGDLATAKSIMRQMFEMPIYRHHVNLLDDYQEIMVGYSDGSKDGGTLTANWKIYRAQIEINQLAKQYGIHVEFFHGRGGSLGRGGGALNRSIVSQPPQSALNGVKITEQGEVLSTRYLLPEIGFRNLEQAVSTLLETVTKALKTAKSGDDEHLEQYWIDSLDEISEAAFRKYRSLIFEDEDLFAYYNDVSPLKNFANLNIGSRPMHRVAKPSFTSLRAIPWVFGWMQNRQLLPAWYAAGTGLKTFRDAKEGNLELMRKMYKDWPLFNAIIDNLHAALMKADMEIAKAYIPLAKNQEAAQRIFANIVEEYDLTKKMVLEISEVDELLAHVPNVRELALHRIPHIDPLNFLQVDLLKTLYGNGEVSEEEERMLLTQLLLTINGVVTGLRNTG
ncbi:MAG: phosphoenolpyruvate carboxylase [Oscillospiraceae bacterium]|nr:phosphoenolpyruvate carboxylase [Oscillospiraceae bacterium]